MQINLYDVTHQHQGGWANEQITVGDDDYEAVRAETKAFCEARISEGYTDAKVFAYEAGQRDVIATAYVDSNGQVQVS